MAKKKDVCPPRGGLRVFHLFMHIGHLLEERCRSELGEYGLHHGQARVLMTLNRHGPVLQADLARGMDIAPPTLSVMLKKLLDQQLVKRASVAGDERVYKISLTESGKRAAGLIHKVWTDAERVILRSLKPADLNQMHAALLRVRDGLGGRGPKL